MAFGLGEKSAGGGSPPGGRPAAQPPRAAPKQPAPGGAKEGFVGLRVSLMPSELEGGKAPDIKRGALILIFVLVLETIGIGGVHFWLSQNTAERIAERGNLDQRISEMNKIVSEQGSELSAAIDFDKQIRAVKDTLDQHIYWTEFFKFMEDNTLTNVRYLRFSGEAESGIFMIDILGRTYRDVAEQIVLYRENPDVVSVRATSASARINQAGEVEGVATSLVIKVDPKIWLKIQAPAAQ